MSIETKMDFEWSRDLNAGLDSPSLSTDQEIMEQISKRNDENHALKKLLENLNTSFLKNEAKP
jgi:hypothetical protein